MILDHERKEDQPTSVTKGIGDSDTIFGRVQNERVQSTDAKILKIRRQTNTHKHFSLSLIFFVFLSSQSSIAWTLFLCCLLLFSWTSLSTDLKKPCTNGRSTLLNDLQAFQLTFTSQFKIKLHRFQSKKQYLAVACHHKVNFQKVNKKALCEECCQRREAGTERSTCQTRSLACVHFRLLCHCISLVFVLVYNSEIHV